MVGGVAFGHRLDEYLQGTILSVGKTRLEAQMTLTPGVAIFPKLVAAIDADGDGVISEKEQRAYAAQVLRDLSIKVDGASLTPELVSVRFSNPGGMKDGLGEIAIDYSAELPRGGRSRKIVLQNHHQGAIAAYQVNCLVPKDPDIRIEAQKRDYLQSVYEVDYSQSNVSPWSAMWWLGAVPLVLFTRLAWLVRRKAPSR
jgi:hypothetical protein